MKLRIEVPTEDVKPYLERAARALSKEHTPKGFRAGNVPLDVMRSTVGDAKIIERALQDLVPRTYVETLLDRDDVEAIGQPEVAVASADFDGPCVYTAEVAVLPEVRLGDYRRFAAAKRPVAVETAEVDRELEHLRKLRASYLSVPRTAATGDRVDVVVSATFAGVPLEMGNEQPQSLLLGEGHLVPGFEERIVGTKEGETKSFSLTFPPQHHREDLREKLVEFRVTVKTVQQRILPSLDDTFAKSLGNFANFSDLKDRLTANLRQEKEQHERDRYQQELVAEIIRRSTFGEFPEVLVERELDTMLGELREGVAGMGLPFETYLAQIKKTIAELHAQWKPKAEERIRAGLTLRAIAHKENITVGDEEITTEVNEVLRHFQNPDDAAKRLDLDAVHDLAAGTIRNRKVFALLEQLASGAAP